MVLLKDRSVLENYIVQNMITVSGDMKKSKEIFAYCYEKYNLPIDLVSDFIAGRKGMNEASEFILFALLDALIEKNNLRDRKRVYFTQLEIDTYSKAKYKLHSITFPLRFKMIQIADDQFIGKITVKELMGLRKAQLIFYNENTQRTMQKIVRGDKEFYKIKINKKAVSSIEAAFKERIYIPNTITLNILFGSEADFYYDASENELVIKSIKSFDISDGYHRYVSLCHVVDIDPDFDYPMELRIINFDEDKTRQFIFQEDQKTKMNKTDSDSFDSSNAAVITVTRLNENVHCNIKGMISRNQGLISFPDLVLLVKRLYFSNVKKSEERVVILQTVKELTECFNYLTEYDLKYLTQKYSYTQLLGVMVTFKYFQGKDKTKMGEVIDYVLDNMDSVNKVKLTNKNISKTLIKEIEQIIKGGEDCV